MQDLLGGRVMAHYATVSTGLCWIAGIWKL